jgi:hypothetical protein
MPLMNSIIQKYFFMIYIVCILAGCGVTYLNKQEITGYNLTKADKVIILPDTLREVSGVTEVDSANMACVQDENGILFIYNVTKGKIAKQFSFNIDGDYEGIARAGSDMYILRSDGRLYEITDYTSGNFRINTYVTGIPASNNEGLCYDDSEKRLLIACKGKIGKGREYKDKRVIYAFDLTTKKLTDQPVFDFNLQEIKQFAIDTKIELPVRVKKKGKIEEPIIRFRTSAICIHPVTKKLFLLSAADYLLFIFDRNGKIEHLEKLNPEMFNKAEGITFTGNGDLFITNEGQNDKPTLLWFHYNKN